MKKFLVATDSGCDLSKQYCIDHDIHILPMKYTSGDKVLTATMDSDETAEFYDRMREGDTPKTTQVSPFEFLEFWRGLPKDLPILHIAMGSGISGTYANGVTAREQFLQENPGVELYIVDSTLASLAYGLLAIRAAQMRDEGAEVQECIDWLESVKLTVNAYFTTDDLTYLHRGGRVSKAGAVAGKILGINPIMKLDHLGRLVMHTKAHGRKGALKRIMELIEEKCIDPKGQILYICHAQVDEKERETIAAAMKERFGFMDVFYTLIGPIIGAHTGPGLYSVFFTGKIRTPQGT